MEENEKSNFENLFHFSSNKAGMENISKEKIQKTIFELTKNSEYTKRELEKKEKNEQKAQAMLNEFELLKSDPQKIKILQEEIEEDLLNKEKMRNCERVWVHFDMDMFYVACEIRDNPDLKEKPVAVGSHSMISTANYVARKYGIRSAMPGFIAVKLCPELILVPPHFPKYQEASKIFKNVLSKYDPDYESMGLDECILDLTNYIFENSVQNIEELCQKMRSQIEKETQLTTSCGISCNRMLAKMASEINKPNGQYFIKSEKEAILEFMKDQLVRKIPGIGKCAEQQLNYLKLYKCKDVLDNLLLIKAEFTPNFYEFILESCLGISTNYHSEKENQKSISNSKTFSATRDPEFISEMLENLSENIESELKEANKLAKNICVNIKNSKFENFSKGNNLEKYVSKKEDILSEAKKLFQELKIKDSIRLLGIKATELIDITKFENNSINKYIKNIENDSKKKKLEDDYVPQVYVCSICNETISSKGNLSKINSHIDACLLKQDGKANINSNINSKQSADAISKEKSNKRKPKNENPNSKKKKKLKNNNTLDNFFRK